MSARHGASLPTPLFSQNFFTPTFIFEKKKKKKNSVSGRQLWELAPRGREHSPRLPFRFCRARSLTKAASHPGDRSPLTGGRQERAPARRHRPHVSSSNANAAPPRPARPGPASRQPPRAARPRETPYSRDSGAPPSYLLARSLRLALRLRGAGGGGGAVCFGAALGARRSSGPSAALPSARP